MLCSAPLTCVRSAFHHLHLTPPSRHSRGSLPWDCLAPSSQMVASPQPDLLPFVSNEMHPFIHCNPPLNANFAALLQKSTPVALDCIVGNRDGVHAWIFSSGQPGGQVFFIRPTALDSHLRLPGLARRATCSLSWTMFN